MLKVRKINPVFSLGAFIFALHCIIFSAWNIWGEEALLCLTQSCEVFSEFSILGYSLWEYGLVYFSIVLFFVLLKQIAIARVLMILALLGDTVLLVLMMLTAPCSDCLLIALFIGLLYLSVHRHVAPNKISVLLLVWLCFFAINVGALLKHMTEPFAIYVNPEHIESPLDASMRIYFSPSCTSCIELVENLGDERNTQVGDIAWFPVAESEADIPVIREMFALVAEGYNLQEAVAIAKETDYEQTYIDIVQDFFMQCKLLVNQSRIAAAGTTRIPFVEYTGIPAHLQAPSPLENLRNLAPSSNSIPSSNFNLGVGGFCDGESDEPC